jgi:catechol 2,3-dioxygenase-like lactoylglutathione lyase family enzyme
VELLMLFSDIRKTYVPYNADSAKNQPILKKEIVMFERQDAIATVAVKKLDTARKFYEGKLGLEPAGSEEPGVFSYKSGNSVLLVYESQYAGTNKATAVTWLHDDVEGAVKDLKAKGVAFEHYDFPDATRKGDVHIAGERKTAWFKDPDGNILALVSAA